jgi:hypothetical protein
MLILLLRIPKATNPEITKDSKIEYDQNKALKMLILSMPKKLE